MRGLWCATLTPLDARHSIDSARFVDHVRGLFAEGIDGIVPFGTTGEGQSFGVAERMAGLEALVAAGKKPQLAEFWIKFAKKIFCGQATPLLIKHRLMTGCTAAAF